MSFDLLLLEFDAYPLAPVTEARVGEGEEPLLLRQLLLQLRYRHRQLVRLSNRLKTITT